jgi:hypothetical protein
MVAKVFVIKLVDCCVRTIFIAVKRHACLRSTSQPESIIHATIIAIESSQSSLQSIKSFAIIVMVELLVYVTIIPGELALLPSSL